MGRIDNGIEWADNGDYEASGKPSRVEQLIAAALTDSQLRAQILEMPETYEASDLAAISNLLIVEPTGPLAKAIEKKFKDYQIKS